MSEGWFAMHRGWRDNPVFKGEFSRADAWIWMIEAACWKPTRFDIRGKTVTLERGQFCGTLRQLADAWGWSKSSVERFLTRLETETMIIQEPGHSKSVITICNYAKYQDMPNADRDKVGTANGTKLGQSWDTKEQGNKGTIEIGEEAKASPPRRAKPVPKISMTPDWEPSSFPPSVAELVAQWPPGRLEREVEDFRAYWIERGEKRPGWDRSFHSRINDIHERILRDNRNGNHGNQVIRSSSGASPDRRSSLARACDEGLAHLDAQLAALGGGT